MPRLIYVAITSLDGHVADANGEFAWAAPDPDVLAAVNDIERPREARKLLIESRCRPASAGSPGADGRSIWP
jgi:hypothetical protein